MKRKLSIIFSIIFLMSLLACNPEKEEAKPNTQRKPNKEEEIQKPTPEKVVLPVVDVSKEIEDVELEFTINPKQKFQEIEGFGASDCWLAEYVGSNYSAVDKDNIAKLLFSKDENPDGSPSGIGLSMYRMNLGAGTMDVDSKITKSEHRTHSFLLGDNYKWDNCPGQVYFLEEAAKYKVENLVFFCNSPLVQYTINGDGRSDMGLKANLKEDCYDKFAEYLASVIEHFNQNGIFINYISPVNEPQYDWSGKDQEGTAFTNSQIKKLATEIDKALTQKNLNTQILLGETAKYECLTGNTGQYPNCEDVIKDLFTLDSENYLLNLPHVKKAATVHAYWQDANWKTLKESREQAQTLAFSQSLPIWQTEWSALGDHIGSSSEFVEGGYQKATYMDIALWLSKVIHSDLCFANCQSWSYWTIFDQERWSQKNRFYLIKLGKDNCVDYQEDYSAADEFNSYKDNVNLWVLGNYSRFVRPGFSRIDVNLESESYAKNLWASGYLSPSNKELVLVYSNNTDEKIRINATMESLGEIDHIERYQTTSELKLKRDNVSSMNFVLVPKSVVTCRVIYK